MLNIAIIEDNENDAKALLTTFKRYENEAGEVINAVWFKNAEAFLMGYKPIYDVVFMDIVLGKSGLDGMAAARRMRQYDSEVKLIFITTMTQFAIDGYEVNAFDYFLKPASYYKIKMRLDRARRLAKSDCVYVMANVNDAQMRISSDDIYYVEVITHTLNYHTCNGVYCARGVLKNIEKILAPAGFARCGISYLVNLNKIKSIKKNTLVVGDDELRITRGKQKEFMTTFVRFINGEHRGGEKK